MKKNINIDKEVITVLYKKNKEYFLPLGIIIICVALFIFVIIPQIYSLFDLQKKSKQEFEKLNVLKTNYTNLLNINDATLTSQYNVTSSVLPVGKDFAGILNAVSIAASKAGLSLGAFEFSVGDLSKPPTSVKKFPILELTLNLEGDTNGASRFIKELYKTAPISEIINVKTNYNSVNATINFYYKAIPPVNFNEQTPLKMLSGADLTVLSGISKWANTERQIISPSASSSGGFNANPF
ncbi:MAG TPA: hypothetical protein VFD45_02960 [Patescibacteria group bacterium]|nr:hypothetical protein [Patescibacteria group bacterium]